MKLHTEEKEVPVYALVVAKGGPKMKPATEQSDFKQLGYPNLSAGDRGGVRGIGLGGGELAGIKATMDDLTRALAGGRTQQELERPVVNRTGLTGKYDFKLQWTPNLGPASSQLMADASETSIFTAIEDQLGLKLESQKGPLQILVIDRVERPSEN